jgi:Protein of unknown function (DUF998)
MTTLTASTVPTTATTNPTTTRRLLRAGAVAAPLFAVVALAQAAARPGYDLTRHPVSMLALGDLGWIQTANFVVCGVLMLVAAVGVRRARRGQKGGTWGPILFVTQGVGLLVASAFEIDPGDGFPIGTPAGAPTTMSWHMLVHNAGGSLTFFTMIAACFVLARVFDRKGKTLGRVCAVAFAVGLVWAMTGGAAGSLTLFLGVVIAWAWESAALVKLSR